jgi:hypothetical protein
VSHSFDDFFVRSDVPPTAKDQTLFFHGALFPNVWIFLRQFSTHLLVPVLHRVQNFVPMVEHHGNSGQTQAQGLFSHALEISDR